MKPNRLSIAILPFLLAACGAASQDNNVAENSADEKSQETQNLVLMDNVNAAKAADFITAHPKAVVIDVRTPDEFAEGHIAHAINVDYRAEDFRGQLDALDKNAHYVLHCKSGNRSGKSLEIMKELGFSRITHMDGGFDGWKAAGLDVAQ